MGNLPLTRTVTLTPSDPVPSNLLNELQDRAIITSGAQDIFIGADAFSDSGVGSGTATLSTANIWTFVNDRIIILALMLPVGTTITDLRISANRGSGTTQLGAIQRRSFGDGGFAFISNVIETDISFLPTAGVWTIGPGPFAPSARPAPYTTITGAYYFLRVQQGGTGTSQFDGVRLSIQGP